jgi:hypothetical protein
VDSAADSNHSSDSSHHDGDEEGDMADMIPGDNDFPEDMPPGHLHRLLQN